MKKYPIISSLNGVATVSGYNGFRKTIKQNASVSDTLRHMKMIAERDFLQVKDLAQDLQGNSVAETAENIWNWLRQNTVYKLDQSGLEELRTPARSMVDRLKGIDCDDYTILISALLLNLNIPHEYRVAAYHEKGRFEHIYPVAFDEFGNEYVIDVVPEIPHFNYEAEPIVDLKIVKMELQELSGLSESAHDLESELNEPFVLGGMDDEFDEDDLLEVNFLSGLQEVENEEEADVVLSGAQTTNLIERGLLAEVNKALHTLLKERNTPSEISKVVNVEPEIEWMEDLMDAWDDEEDRVDVLKQAIHQNSGFKNFYQSILISLDQLSKNGLSGFDDEPIYLQRIDLSEALMENDLGARSRAVRKGRLKKLLKKVGSGVKKGLQSVVRYNPGTMAMRGAILLLMKSNFLKMSEKIIYGYLTYDQAVDKNLDISEWKKYVEARRKIEGFYVKIGGKADKLKAAIVKGRASKKTGLNLGSVTVASAAATASPFIVFAKKILSKVNPAKLFNSVKSKIADHREAKAKEEAIADEVTAEVASSFSETNPLLTQNERRMIQENVDENAKPGLMDKVKSIWRRYKKPIIITGVGAVITLVAIVFYKKAKSKKRRSLAGIKAARTRARNQRRKPATRRAPRRKTLGKGSTTIIRVPSKSIQKSRVSRRSNASRLKAMHSKAQQLKKKHPNAKYATLLKRASKMI